MQAAEIRKSFLDFFQGKGHLVMPSASFIPAGDPTLLLTSAGMVQFKPYFTGEMEPPGRRLTSVQKCFRTTDIDEVGDTSHNTFFEMLGNFSIGDYFKEEAIAWAWEYITEHLKLAPEQLWATVFLDDDDAHDLWVRTGVPAERIRRFGETDNWWGPAGNEGPCGPCSEIHYDFGGECRLDKPESECGPNCECGRFLELWNLVFMQFYQDPQGVRTPLPAPNIDTGMGLERAARILQGVDSAYETDLFKPIVARVEELTGVKYGVDPEKDTAIRVVAEHARSAAFLIADGVVPTGRDERGSVLRRVTRRAIRYGSKLGLESTEGGFLAPVAEVVIDHMGEHYPELASGRKFVLQILQQEEEQFGEVFERGVLILNGLVNFRRQPGLQKILSKPEQAYRNKERFEASLDALANTEALSLGTLIGYAEARESLLSSLEKGEISAWASILQGAEVFMLWDTFGFPPELTAEIVRENGLEGIDWEGFEREMEALRQRSRAAGEKFGGDAGAQRRYEPFGQTAFLGYETTTVPSEIMGLLVEGTPMDSVSEGQEIEVILRETPFYAESGGQVGDAGELEGPNGTIQVEDTQSPVTGLTIHRGRVTGGTVATGETVVATVDRERRQDAARNHTATHLLHAALRQVLGTHVRQAGSLVAPDRLRFDFTHVSPLTADELRSMERLVNAKVRENVSVRKRETTFRQATADGALAFFGDRYGDQVRVVEVANGDVFSLEVCGGTHVDATGDVGYIHVVGESSIGAGMRRIEALSGRAAESLAREQSGLLERVAQQLETSPKDLESRVTTLTQEVARLRRAAAAGERAASRVEAQELLARVQDMDGLKVVVERAQVSSAEALRETGDWLRDKLDSGVVVLGAVVNDRPTLIAMVTADLVDRGLHAGNIVKEAARTMGGGGGGRPEMAQAGGRRSEALDDALRTAVQVIRSQASAS